MKQTRLILLLAFLCLQTIQPVYGYDVEINGIYYNLVSKAKEAEVTVNPNKYSGNIVIPETIVYQNETYKVTKIGKNAFYVCSELTSIDIPNTITEIDDESFQACTSLSEVIIPNGVKSIGKWAFTGCVGLKSVNIPNSVTEIRTCGFSNCSNLSSVTIPNSITTLEYLVFSGCSSLKKVDIPESVINISRGAFYQCTGLTSISLPSSLTKIGEEAFEGCISLITIIIPNSVSFIGYNAFANCDKLVSVTIGSSVAYIRSKAFYQCPELANVYCYADKVPNTSSDAFKDSHVDYCTLYVPLESIQKYSEESPWNEFGKIKTIGEEPSYVLSVSCNQGGTVGFLDDIISNSTISKEVEENQCVTLTITPYSGYQLKKVEVNNQDVTSSVVNNQYTINSITENTTVSVTFEFIPVTITAKSYTREYGDANPTFEYTASGGSFLGTPSITCSATKTSPVGTYPIVITQGSVDNNNATFVNGTLTITKAPLTAKAKSYTRKQGEANPNFEIEYSGWKNNETASVLTKKPIATTTATTNSAPGTYPITVSGGEAQNYSFNYVNGTLTVVEADAVVITAQSFTREYGEPNPTFEYSVEGGSISGKPNISCEATKSSPVGTYPIVISQGSVNYPNVTYINGTLTITKAPLTAKAKSYSRKQGEANPNFEIGYSGWKNNETESVLTKKPTATTTATTNSAPGTYPIIVSGGEAKNYDFNYVSGTLTITAVDAIVVTAKSYTRAYGEENPTFEYTTEGGTITGQPYITCSAKKDSSVGTYDIVISKGTIDYPNVTFVNGTLTIEKAYQTLTWEQNLLDIEQYSQVELTAEASSGLAVSYQLKDESICSVSTIGQYNYLDCFGLGETIIYAEQAGNDNWWQTTKTYNTIRIVNTSGIENETWNAGVLNGSMYDLQGRKLNPQHVLNNSNLRKGIYIVNGKKVVK